MSARPTREREAHSLHLWRQGHAHRPGPGTRPKGDRFVVGLVAGALLLYLFGRALGLGRDA